ncbi:MAG: extracellular solute-binding protein [Fusicatenibacter sp.]|nr:extracellular solute-binding protein [Fusicatenibacter sp.]
MKRKIVALTLVGAMLMGTMAACGNDSGTSSNSGSAAGSSTAESAAGSDSADGSGDTASTGEKVKLKALIVSHPLTQDINNMKWLQEIEDKAGVEIEWEQIYTDWDTTKSTRFAAGDIPDLLFNATVDSDYTTYNGLFMDLTDLIEKNAPNIQEMFDEVPDTKVLATTKEGKIYGVPKFQGKWPETNTTMFINKTWLDNLGLEVPTTFTELESVLEAFKEQDANGNGDTTDEIPFDFNGWFSGAYSPVNLLGGLGIQLTNWGTDGYFAEDGQIKNYAVDERYKAFMKYMNGLYSKGLINENAITNDYSQFQSLSRGDADGNATVGVTFGWEETDKFGQDLASQYVSFGPLTWDVDGNTYDTRWTYDYSGLNMSSNRVAMSAKCSDPDAAMRFIDQFYDATVSVEGLFGGITDGCIEQTGENSYKVLPPQDSSMDSGTWKWTMSMADNAPMYIRQDTEIEMTQDMDNALKEREVYTEVLAKVDPKKDYYPQMFMKYSDADQNTMAMDQANIANITDNYWSLWMTGESDIDADWDSYVESVNAAGMGRKYCRFVRLLMMSILRLQNKEL